MLIWQIFRLVFVNFCVVKIAAFDEISIREGISREIPLHRQSKTPNGLEFSEIFEIDLKTHNEFTVKLPEKNENSTGFAVFQVHSYHFNVTLSLDKFPQIHQNGTNLGFVIFKEQKFHLFNLNLNSVKCMITFITYDKEAPIPGACNSLAIHPTINVKLMNQFVGVSLARAKLGDSDNSSCESENDDLIYESFYLYLDQDDFDPDAYFDGIKKMMFGDLAEFGIKSKQPEPSTKQYYTKLVGRCQIFTTKVTSKTHGKSSFYIPAHTYSCENGLWGKHCIDSPILNRMFSALIILVSIVQMFNVLMPNFIESVVNGGILGTAGMLFLHQYFEWAMSYFEVILSSIFVGLLVAVILGSFSCYFKKIGSYSSRYIVGYIIVVYSIEFSMIHQVSLPLQLVVALVISVSFLWIKITFSVICGAFFMVFGLSSILRGSLHRALLNNFEVLAAPSFLKTEKSLFDPMIKPNPINYSLALNSIDYVLLVFYLLIVIVITAKKECFFKEHPEVFETNSNICSTCNEISTDYNKTNARRRSQRHYGTLQNGRDHLRKVSHGGRRHYFYRTASGGRNPLISHWARDESEGSDNVFESPESNSRFMSRLSLENNDRMTTVRWREQ